jgi:hypothetical protein
MSEKWGAWKRAVIPPTRQDKSTPLTLSTFLQPKSKLDNVVSSEVNHQKLCYVDTETIEALGLNG